MNEKTEIIREMQAQAEAAHQLRSAAGGLEKWLGRVVKIGFEQRSDPHILKEWMWVEITGVRGGNLTGLLVNRPRYATHLRYGSEVTFAESEIVALSEPERQ